MDRYRYPINPGVAREKLEREIHEGVRAEVDKRKKTTGSGGRENLQGLRGRGTGRGGCSRRGRRVTEVETSGEEF